MSTARRTRSGFTLLEMLIAMTVVGLIAGNVVMVMRSSGAAYDSETSNAKLELQLDQTLDRIVLALMAASVNSLDPNAPVPTFHRSLEFQQSLGVDEGEFIATPPERIDFVVEEGQIVWREKPDQPDERSVVWSRWVADFMEGELPNGVDDNGNGLIDESGLSFVIQGTQLTVYLTLERPDANGRRTPCSRSAIVHCRNS